MPPCYVLFHFTISYTSPRIPLAAQHEWYNSSSLSKLIPLPSHCLIKFFHNSTIKNLSIPVFGFHHFNTSLFLDSILELKTKSLCQVTTYSPCTILNYRQLPPSFLLVKKLLIWVAFILCLWNIISGQKVQTYCIIFH